MALQEDAAGNMWDDGMNELDVYTVGDQPGDYDQPTNPQTPGAFVSPGDQPGDYDQPTNPQTPGAFGGSSGFSWEKLFGNLGAAGKGILGYAQNNPLQALTMLAMLSKIAGDGNKQTVGGYKGPGINMGLTATRNPVAMPKMDLYSGKPVYGPTGGGVTYAAEGGIMGAAHGRYLQGSTDGMADKIDTSIDGKQPAKLSHGEFVIPADVVSHLGNGNSDAGADVLYNMMDRIRKARTGTKKQGKRINPGKFMPGGAVEDAKYAGGGAVAFEAGGSTSTNPGTTTESNIASWAGPYITDYLSKSAALAKLPYQSFAEWSGGSPLTAGESPLQTQAFQGLAGLTQPGQFQTATDFLTQAGQRAAGLGYTPQNVYAPNLQQYQMQAPRDVSGAQAQAAQLGATPQAQAAQFQGPGGIGYDRVAAERVAAPQLRDLQMQAAAPIQAQQYGTPQMQAAQTSYQPNLQQYQMAAPQQVTTQGFDTGAAQGLMSPYMQSVVERQQQAAQREADIQAQAQKAQFAQAGAFGGGRQGVAQARAAEALARQKGDIQAQGLQSAYQQAQQQFNTQQQQALAAQQANQQAGLTAGGQNLQALLSTQQLGTQAGLQTALANLNNQQQAQVQNQAAQLQTQGMNAQQALQVALANQQNQQQANLQNLSAGLQTQGLQAQTGMQAQQLNQATGLQALLANQQAGMQTGQFNAQQAYNTALQNAQLQQQANLANQQMMGQYGLQQGQFGQAANLQNAQLAQQAALANQQMGYNVGQQNLNALLGIQSLGAGQNLQAQLANQQAGQFGANLGLQANQQLLGAGQALGGLGQTQFGTQLQGLQALLGAGGQQQQTAQAGITALQNEYNKQMMYPYQQLQFQQSMLQGLPVQAYSNMQNLSPLQNIGQGITQLGGLWNLFNPTAQASTTTKP